MTSKTPTVSDCKRIHDRLFEAHNALQDVQQTYTFPEVQHGLKGVTLQYRELTQLITQIQEGVRPNVGYCWDLSEIDNRLQVLYASKENIGSLISNLDSEGLSLEELGAKKNSPMAFVDRQVRDCRQALIVIEQKLQPVYDFLKAYYGKNSPHRKGIEKDAAVLRPKKKKGFFNTLFKT